MFADSEKLESQLQKLRELEGDLTFRIAIVNRILENQVIAIVSEHGLSLTAYRLLLVTSIFEATSLSELGRLMMIDRAQISRTAAQLEKSGLVVFGQEGENKRKKIVSLSDEGRALVDQLAPAFEARLKKIKDAVGQDAMPGLWQAIDNLSRMNL